jgi:stage III sporulation protein AG
MDWLAVKEKAGYFLRKYRYVLLILLVGIVLMCLPGGEEPEQERVSPEQTDGMSAPPDPEERLRQILSQIEGAGKVEVLLTPLAGEETVYQTDEDLSANGDRMETVIITDAQRSQQGLVKQVNPPVYLGAVVVCQGADRASVRLAIVEAVANATGLGADKISVLKMK